MASFYDPISPGSSRRSSQMSQPGRSPSIPGSGSHMPTISPHQFSTMCQSGKPTNMIKTAMMSPVNSPNYHPLSPLANHMSPNPSVLSPNQPNINSNGSVLSPNSNVPSPNMICQNVLSPSSNILSPIYNSNVSPLTANHNAPSPMSVDSVPTLTNLGPALSPVRNILSNTSNLVLQVCFLLNIIIFLRAEMIPIQTKLMNKCYD